MPDDTNIQQNPFEKFWQRSGVSWISLNLTGLTVLLMIIGFFSDSHSGGAQFGFHPKLLILLPIIAFSLAFWASRHDDPTSQWKKILFVLRYSNLFLILGYALVWFNGFRYLMWILLLIALGWGGLTAFKLKDELADELANFLATDSVADEDEVPDDDAGPGDFLIGYRYKRNVDEDGKTPDGEMDYIPTKKKAVLHLHDRFVHLLALGVTGTGKTSQLLLPMFYQDFQSDNFHYENIDVVQLGQIIIEPKGDYAETAWAIGKVNEATKRTHYQKFLLDVPQKLNQRIADLINDRNDYLAKQNGTALSKADARRLAKLEAQRESSNYINLSYDDQLDIEQEISNLQAQQNGRELTREEQQDLQLTELSIRKLLYIREHLSEYINLSSARELSADKFSNFALFRYASLLTNIIANPAQCDDVWEELTNQDPLEQRDLVMLFDPQNSQNTLYFNPLYGDEEAVKATVTSTLISFMADSSDFFKNQAQVLANNAISVVKRVFGNDATFNHVVDVMNNDSGRGEEIIHKLLEIDATGSEEIFNRDLANYFLNDYYTGMATSSNGGAPRGGTKTYEQTNGLRAIVDNLLSDSHIKKVLNPPPGVGTSLDFDNILLTGDKVAISTQTGVSDAVGKMLGAFIMLQLQQAIGRRPGKENTRTPVIMYIDEFQDYASGAFEDVLTKGRSYCVSAVMATQTLGIVAQKAGQGLVDNLQSNARNVIVYPGASVQDAQYFMSLFGTYTKSETNRTISQAVEEDPTRMDKIKAAIGLGGDDDGDAAPPRESVSEKESTEYLFDETQIMYGINAHCQVSGKAKAFGTIYYRIVKDKSPQMPSAAAIQYIPIELKHATDKLVKSYEATRDNGDLVADTTTADTNTDNADVDPLAGEQQYNQQQFEAQQNTKITLEETEDPSQLARDKSGKATITSVAGNHKVAAAQPQAITPPGKVTPSKQQTTVTAPPSAAATKSQPEKQQQTQTAKPTAPSSTTTSANDAPSIDNDVPTDINIDDPEIPTIDDTDLEMDLSSADAPTSLDDVPTNDTKNQVIDTSDTQPDEVDFANDDEALDLDELNKHQL